MSNFCPIKAPQGFAVPAQRDRKAYAAVGNPRKTPSRGERAIYGRTLFRKLCPSRGKTLDTHLIYITTGSKDEAKRIGKAIVKSGLAACVNIIENMSSMYMWDGKLQNDKETILMVKTTKARARPD